MPPRPSTLARPLGCALDVFVVALAVLSLATWSFHLWIDLRFAGPIIAVALPLLWTVSVLLLPVLLRKNASPALLRPLLWPTYLLLICAAANAVYYYRLWMLDRIDVAFPVLRFLPPVPMCGWVSFLLIAWVFTVRRRVRLPEAARPSRVARALAVLWLIICTGVVAGFFYLHTSQSPPRSPVDVAVVLGNRVLPDGRASVVLTDRTLAAVDLYKRGLVRKIILSGMIDTMPDGQPDQSEVLAMRQVCLDHGVPDRDLILDPVGFNTRATVYNTRELMRQHGWKTVVGVSHAYHLPRIHMTFGHAGIACFTAAAKPTEWVQADITETAREVAALVTYALRPSYRPAKVLEMSVKNPRIHVSKSANTLSLFDGDKLVKTYPCVTGTYHGDKEIEGDRKTPLGTFRIVFKNAKSKYHLSLGLNYPQAEDADRGLKAGLITQEQHDTIVRLSRQPDLSNETDQIAYWKTPLGGEIFVHGESPSRNGTAGCVKVSNPDIEEIYAVCPLGTVVEIAP